MRKKKKFSTIRSTFHSLLGLHQNKDARRRRRFVFEAFEQRLPFAVEDSFAGPDVVVTRLSVPSQVSVGGTIPVSWSVENQGQVTEGGRWRDGFYISKDDVLDTSDFFVTWYFPPTSRLVTGDTYEQTFDTKIPENISITGNVFALLKVDYSG